jgi:4'-phosphopantetheinyl transferase
MLIWHKKDFLLVCYFTNNGFDDESESWIARKMVIDYSRQLFEVVDCEIGEEENGKKFFINEKEVCFNISHTKGCIVIAMRKGGQIGIDVECVRKKSDKVIERYFSMDEKEQIQNADNVELAETVIWTKKEAYAKCTGEGLNRSTLSINTMGNRFVLSNKEVDDSQGYTYYKYETILVKQFVITVCYVM